SAPGSSRARKSDRCRQDRNLVPGRGSYRPEEQDHPQVGQTRHSPERSAGSANRIDLYLRYLPKTGQGRGSDPALLQYRSDEPAPRGNSQGGRTRSPRRPPRRPGRMASVSKIAHSRQHHHSRPAAEMPYSIPLKTSGSTCATTGSRTASSNPTTISSIIAATPGIPLSTDPGRSCLSDCANGRTSSNQ